MISLVSYSIRNVAMQQARVPLRNSFFMGRRFCTVPTENLDVKLQSIIERMIKLESSRMTDVYKYRSAVFGTGLAALFGAGYIDKRIDDMKTHLEKRIDGTDKRIDDMKTHLEKRIELMEKNIIHQITLSSRGSKLS